MATNVVPKGEVEILIRLILQNFHQQYNRSINAETLDYAFITPRTDCRFGFELITKIDGEFFRIRLYCKAFVIGAQIDPYRQEEVQDQPLGYGDEVFVSITNLPLGFFPKLSKINNPILGDDNDPFGIELEDGSGFITSETGENLQLEGN